MKNPWELVRALDTRSGHEGFVAHCQWVPHEPGVAASRYGRNKPEICCGDPSHRVLLLHHAEPDAFTP